MTNTQEQNTTQEQDIEAIVENLADNEYYCKKCDRVYEYRDNQQQCCERCNAMIDDDQIAGRE